MAAGLTTDNPDSTTARIRRVELTSWSDNDPPYCPPPEDDEPAYQNRLDYLRLLIERGMTWDGPHWRPFRWLVGLALNLAWLDVRPWRRPRCDIP